MKFGFPAIIQGFLSYRWISYRYTHIWPIGTCLPISIRDYLWCGQICIDIYLYMLGYIGWAVPRTKNTWHTFTNQTESKYNRKYWTRKVEHWEDTRFGLFLHPRSAKGVLANLFEIFIKKRTRTHSFPF